MPHAEHHAPRVRVASGDDRHEQDASNRVYSVGTEHFKVLVDVIDQSAQPARTRFRRRSHNKGLGRAGASDVAPRVCSCNTRRLTRVKSECSLVERTRCTCAGRVLFGSRQQPWVRLHEIKLCTRICGDLNEVRHMTISGCCSIDRARSNQLRSPRRLRDCCSDYVSSYGFEPPVLMPGALIDFSQHILVKPPDFSMSPREEHR